MTKQFEALLFRLDQSGCASWCTVQATEFFKTPFCMIRPLMYNRCYITQNNLQTAFSSYFYIILILFLKRLNVYHKKHFCLGFGPMQDVGTLMKARVPFIVTRFSFER